MLFYRQAVCCGPIDALYVHKTRTAEKALAVKGAWFLYLPNYSTNLKPMEMAFSKLKVHLWKSAG